MANMNSKITRFGALALLATLALVGCAPADGGASTASSEAATTAAESITVTDGWVKAAETGMTAAFGVIENNGSDEVVIVSATSPVADAVELHETTTDASGASVMRELEGGFAVPAGLSLHLEPGGNHLMFMGLTAPVKAGDEVAVELTFSDGSELALTLPVKDFAGANENYEHGGDDEMDGEH